MVNFLINYKKTVTTLIFLLVGFLIIFQFTSTPKVWVDEGVFTETARVLAEHGTLGIQTEPNQYFSMRNFLLSTSYPVIFPVALSLKVFGVGLWQARLTMLIYMFGLTVLFFLFSKKRYGFYPAIQSVLLLVSFSPFYGNGRPVQGEVPGLALLLLGAFLFLYFEESDFLNKRYAFFSGIAFGLSAAVKPIFLVLLPVSIFIALVLNYKKIIKNKTIFIFCSGLVLPVILWCLVHFPTIKELMDFIPNLLFFSSNHGEKIPLMHVLFTNSVRFFTESTPILFAFLLFTIVFSILYRKYKKTDLNLRISEMIVFIFLLLDTVGYLFGTGWYRYFFPAHTLLYLFFPACILFLANDVRNKILKKILFIIPVFLMLFQFYHLVFLSDTSYVVKRVRNSEISNNLSKLDSNKKILFYGTIEALVYWRGEDYDQYFSMGFLDTGNKDVINRYVYDYILSDSKEIDSFSSVCYDRTSVDRYYLFTRRNNCK